MSGIDQNFDSLPLEEKFNLLAEEYRKLKRDIDIVTNENNRLSNENGRLLEELNSFKNQDEEEDEEMSDDCEETGNEDFPTIAEANKQKRKKGESDDNDEEPKSKKPQVSSKTTPPSASKSVKTTKPPAIMAFTEDVKNLRSEINKFLGNNNTILFLLRSQVKIQNLTKEDFEKTKDLLNKTNTKYFTFTAKDEKPFTLLIKNITNQFQESEVEDAVREKIPDVNILNLKNFNSRMWIVQLKDAESASKIKKLRSLLGFGIVVTKYNGKKILQCRNCQRYNHLAINCKMDYRCVKCAENHGPQKCQIPKKEENIMKIVIEKEDGTKETRIGRQLKCANCSGEHAANYSKCPVREKMMKERESPVTTPTLNNIPTTFRKDNVSYRNVVINNQSKSNESRFNINNEIENIFGKNLNTCLNKINNFIPNYKNLKNNEEKKVALFNIMFDLCLN